MQTDARKFEWREVALWVGLALVAYAALWPVYFSEKSLSHDDVALFITARDEGPLYWISKGYSEFFELSQYPFIRPVSHALMRFDQIAFGTAYGLYFLPFFLLLGLGAWAGVKLAAALELPRWAQFAMGLGFLLQPAWLTPGLQFVTFQQDALAGIFSVLAALACLRHKWLIAFICLLLAPYTKEIALFAPIAAAAWALIWGKSWRASLLMISPLIIWGVVRVTMVGSLTGGTYVTSTSGSMITSVIRGLAIWPTGFTSPAEIKAFAAAIRGQGLGAIVQAPWVAFSLSLNLLLDLLIAVAGVMTLKRLSQPSTVSDPAFEAEGLVLIWTLGALGLALLVAYELRFAGALHPMLLLLIARLAVAQHDLGDSVIASGLRLTARAALVLLGLGMAITTVTQLGGQHSNVEPRAFAALSRAVAAVPPSLDDRILVLDAPVSGPASRWMMAFWNRPGSMHMLSRAHGCLVAKGVNKPRVTPLPGGRVKVALDSPPCSETLVLWSDDKAALAQSGKRLSLDQGVTVNLSFPQARVESGTAAGAVPDVDFGHLLVAEFDPSQFTRVLVRNWEDGSYQPLQIKGEGQ